MPPSRPQDCRWQKTVLVDNFNSFSDVRPNFLYHLPCSTRTPPVLKCRTVKNCNLPPPPAASSSSSSSSSLATSLLSHRGSRESTMEQQLTERVLAAYTCPANVAARATAANKRVLLEDWMAGWNTSRPLLIQKTYVHDRQYYVISLLIHGQNAYTSSFFFLINQLNRGRTYVITLR